MQTLLGKPQYRVEHVVDVPGLIRWWAFFVAGWQDLCSPVKGRGDLTLDEFLSVLLRVVSIQPRDGLLAVIASKNEKPLAFCVVMEDSETPRRRTALIYAGYSNEKDKAVILPTFEYVETWAKANGFVELHAQTNRFSGAAMRWFRKKLRFTPKAVLFSKAL